MKIILDTNIIFSGIANSNGVIGDLIINSDGIFEFYSCNYMRFELKKHWNKLKNISKLTDQQLAESEFRIFKKINFIDEEIIPEKFWIEAENITADIDIDDTDFVALTTYLKGYLWTGDKELYNGLKRKDFKRVYYTRELLAIREMKQFK